MKSKDILGKTVARVVQETIYSETFRKNVNAAYSIEFTDGSRIVLHAVPDENEDFVDITYQSKRK